MPHTIEDFFFDNNATPDKMFFKTNPAPDADGATQFVGYYIPVTGKNVEILQVFLARSFDFLLNVDFPAAPATITIGISKYRVATGITVTCGPDLQSTVTEIASKNLGKPGTVDTDPVGRDPFVRIRSTSDGKRINIFRLD